MVPEKVSRVVLIMVFCFQSCNDKSRTPHGHTTKYIRIFLITGFSCIPKPQMEMQIEIGLAGVKLLDIFKDVGSIVRQDGQGYALSSDGPTVQKASNDLNIPHTKPSSEAPKQGWKCLKFSSQRLASHHATRAVKLFNGNLCWEEKKQSAK